MRIRERLYDGVKIVGGAFGYGEGPVSVLGSLSVSFSFSFSFSGLAYVSWLRVCKNA